MGAICSKNLPNGYVRKNFAPIELGRSISARILQQEPTYRSLTFRKYLK